jgi:dipeptidyl aminopeptidase/acylaminoacyl peptidase
MPVLTADMIVDAAYPEQIQLSPDGTELAYTLVPQSTKEAYPVSAIWRASTAGGSSSAHQLTSGDARDHTPKWSPDGSKIAFLSDRATRGTPQLFLIQRDGGEARSLTSGNNTQGVKDFAWSPGGSQIAFISADEQSAEDEECAKNRDDAEVFGEHWRYDRLHLLDLATGNVTTLVRGARHITSFAWSPDGKELAYVACQSPEYEARVRESILERVDLEAFEPSMVCLIPSRPSSPTWSPDGQYLLLIGGAERFEQTSFVVYRVPRGGGKPERIAPGIQQCVRDLLWPGAASRAIVLLWEGLKSNLCWLDAVTGQLAPLLASTTDGLAGLAHVSVCCPPGGQETVVALARSSEGRPWQVWAGRCGDEGHQVDLKQVTAHNRELEHAGIPWGRQEPFIWTAADGWELDGVLVLPPNTRQADRLLPLVVVPHGGPYDRSDLRFQLGAMGSGWAQWLAADGYAVLLPNYRGGSGHGERFAAAVRGDVGGAEYADCLSAVDAAIERGIADPERVGIGGCSQGGNITAWTVTQTSRFKAAVMGVGITDWGMLCMTSNMPQFQRELAGSAPWDGVEARQHILRSPISYVGNVQTPLLILHGQNDPIVPVDQAAAFHRALRSRQVPCELVTYPREGHAFAERAHQIDALLRVRAWFNRWLKEPNNDGKGP